MGLCSGALTRGRRRPRSCVRLRARRCPLSTASRDPLPFYEAGIRYWAVYEDRGHDVLVTLYTDAEYIERFGPLPVDD